MQNGLALRKLHHAAFDRQFIGIKPDYVVEARREILDEEDGPMLLHGLKGIHRERILLPWARELWPNPELLAARFARFEAPSP